jgi:hypothetical protein
VLLEMAGHVRLHLGQVLVPEFLGHRLDLEGGVFDETHPLRQELVGDRTIIRELFRDAV